MIPCIPQAGGPLRQARAGGQGMCDASVWHVFFTHANGPISSLHEKGARKTDALSQLR